MGSLIGAEPPIIRSNITSESTNIGTRSSGNVCGKKIDQDLYFLTQHSLAERRSSSR